MKRGVATSRWGFFAVASWMVFGCGEADPPAGAKEVGVDSPADSGVATNDGGPVSLDGGVVSGSLASFNDMVFASAHAGSAWYVGGSFTAVGLIPAPRFLSLSTQGVPSASCNLGVGFQDEHARGEIRASVLDGNTLYLGGKFTTYKGVAVHNIAKLDATTCALDTAFSGPTKGFDGQVNALLLSAGKLYVGGEFRSHNSAANSANGVAVIDPATGTLDSLFGPPGVDVNGFNGPVYALAISGTSLYVGGGFSAYKGVAESASSLAKLDLATGTLDTTFSPKGTFKNGFSRSGLPGLATSMVVSGSSLYVGGRFDQYRGATAFNLAKLDLGTGALDKSFAKGVSGDVWTLARAGSSLLVGGNFTSLFGTDTGSRIAKIDLATGAPDPSFHISGAANGFTSQASEVRSIAVNGNDLYVGGGFSSYRGAPVNNLARLNLTTGTLESGFLPNGHDQDGTDSQVQTIAVSGTTLWIGGMFHGYGGHAANHIAKFDDQTLALDTTFSPALNNGFDGVVLAMAASGNALYVGGGFESYRGVTGSAKHIAKLDLTTGALDTTFSPQAPNVSGFDDSVVALAVSSNALFVGGRFNDYRGVSGAANHIAKLDLATGALDATFSPAGQNQNGFDKNVSALAVNGGAIYVGGMFSSYRGVPSSATRLAKLDQSTGALDATFAGGGGGPDSAVAALAISNNALFVGGSFQSYRGAANTANRIAKVDLATGQLDTTFSPQGGAPNGFGIPGKFSLGVDALAVVGGSLYVGGGFDDYRGVPGSARSLAKLDAVTGSQDMSFSPSGQNGFVGIVDTLSAHGNALFVGGLLDTSFLSATPIGNAALLDRTTGVGP